MAWKNFNVAPVNEGIHDKFAFEVSETLSAAGNGTTFIVPDEIATIAVTVSFTGSAKGKMQHTTDSVAEAKAGTCTWIDWDIGEIGANRTNMCDPVTALRAVQTDTGTMKVSMRAQ